MRLTADPHPLLDPVAFTTVFPAPLGALPADPAVDALFAPGAPAPLAADDALREAVRALLRAGGFKPTGRSKPASEYLRKAQAEGRLGGAHAINPAVDALNAVSLHCGLPISIVDTARLAPGGLRLGLAPAGTRYVFNPSGQELDLGGLLSLFDGEGPCAGPVKDAQRTKTGPSTTETLTVVWGTRALPGQASAAAHWLITLLAQVGGTSAPVAVDQPPNIL